MLQAVTGDTASYIPANSGYTYTTGDTHTQAMSLSQVIDDTMKDTDEEMEDEP